MSLPKSFIATVLLNIISPGHDRAGLVINTLQMRNGKPRKVPGFSFPRTHSNYETGSPGGNGETTQRCCPQQHTISQYLHTDLSQDRLIPTLRQWRPSQIFSPNPGAHVAPGSQGRHWFLCPRGQPPSPQGVHLQGPNTQVQGRPFPSCQMLLFLLGPPQGTGAPPLPLNI